jgi:hypothetical protein
MRRSLNRCGEAKRLVRSQSRPPSPGLSPRKERKRASGEGGPFRPLFLSFSLWRRDSGPWRSCRANQSSDRVNVCPGPLAVRSLGRLCAAEGRFANRYLSEAIADVRASPRDDPSGPCDSRPRSRAAPSAAARVARRLFPSPFWPVKKGTPPTETTHRFED